MSSGVDKEMGSSGNRFGGEKNITSQPEWLAISNEFDWEELNRKPATEADLKEMDESLILSVLEKLKNGDIESIKKNMTGVENCLNVGEVIRLPQGFKFSEDTYHGFHTYTLDFDDEASANFTVTSVDSRYYTIKAVDKKLWFLVSNIYRNDLLNFFVWF